MKFPTLSIFLALLVTTSTAVKTSIFIDQIPNYSLLPSCAEDRVSAIIRAQASGCGDDQQLTSFSCFCVDMSTYYASVISTAVQSWCAINATATVAPESLTAQATLTTPLPEVGSALSVFSSYCAKTTELSLYQGSKPSATGQVTLTITAAPSVTAAAVLPTTSASSGSVVPLAAIVAPIVIGVLAIAGVIGMFFWLRKRVLQKPQVDASSREPEPEPENKAYKASSPPSEVSRDSIEVVSPVHEVVGDLNSREVDGGSVKYELESTPAELADTRR
ncbi:hypothetical protein HYFRA_00000370 [Hymenoscyphus fraxineus]|uniref:Extracellular membrane protein CFEM domain-containing protein n=1 Tax=Hymenoscyphus fraxineus TaxID=746836 RepID=A0A9N9PSH4_9HELO|nr:hypothetical protein HYFRA_00000370 [Hymenoscyphus fraxineus]